MLIIGERKFTFSLIVVIFEPYWYQRVVTYVESKSGHHVKEQEKEP